MEDNVQKEQKRGFFLSFIKGVEIVGNWLPHPF